ncbi:MAG: molybdopterin-binding protein [Anaerolineae bacterium]
MYLQRVTPEEAAGHLLCHHQTNEEGRRVLQKGRIVRPEDVETLRALGKATVYVAVLEANDVLENEAAQALGEVLVRPHITASRASAGRVNLIAAGEGLLKVNAAALAELNSLPGITLATLPTNALVQPRKYVGTVKIIPYAIPKADLEQALEICRSAAVIDLAPFWVKEVTLVTVGSPAAREKVQGGYTPALRRRIEELGGTLHAGPYVPEDEEDLAEALHKALDGSTEMVLVAGETSIVDDDDIIPRAIRAIGGQVIRYGVPVEPGNLLLLAYCDQTPIVGVPGCAKSKTTNVVDLVFRRLMAGERLTQTDLIEFGHGGYLI